MAKPSTSVCAAHMRISLALALSAYLTGQAHAEPMEYVAGQCKVVVSKSQMNDFVVGGKHYIWIGECKDGLASGSGKVYLLMDNAVRNVSLQVRDAGKFESAESYFLDENDKLTKALDEIGKPQRLSKVKERDLPAWASGVLGKPLAGYPALFTNPNLEQVSPLFSDESREAVREYAKSQLFEKKSEQEALTEASKSQVPSTYFAFIILYPNNPKREEFESKLKGYVRVTTMDRPETILTNEELRKKYNWNGEDKIFRWDSEVSGIIRDSRGRRVFFGRLVYGNLLFNGSFRAEPDGLHILRSTSVVYPLQPEKK